METPAAPERLWPRYVRVVEALVCIRVFFVVVRGCPRRLAAEVDYWSLLGSAPAFLWLAHSPQYGLLSLYRELAHGRVRRCEPMNVPSARPSAAAAASARVPACGGRPQLHGPALA